MEKSLATDHDYGSGMGNFLDSLPAKDDISEIPQLPALSSELTESREKYDLNEKQPEHRQYSASPLNGLETLANR